MKKKMHNRDKTIFSFVQTKRLILPKILLSCEPACMAVRSELQPLRLVKLGVTYKECVKTGEKLQVY